MRTRNQVYILNVKVADSLTDIRAAEYIKSWDFYLKDWQAFIKSSRPFYNAKAEMILDFFVSYDKIALCPDFFGTYEPVKNKFDTNNLIEAINCVAFPAGTLIMRKRNMFDIVIENMDYGCSFWADDNYKVFRPKKKNEEFLGNIRINIKKTDMRYSFEQMKTIVDDMCEFLKTEYGTIYVSGTKEMLYKYQK